MALHVVGNLCLDTTFAVARFPEPGETLVAEATRVGLGGKGLNQAVAAARAGADVVLHAAVGAADVEAVTRDLAREPRLALRLAPQPSPTDSSTVLVRADGENMIVSAGGCAKAFDPLAEPELLRFESGDILLMQGNLTPDATQRCLADARRRGARTVLNPSPLWAEELDGSRADRLILNQGELRRLTGEEDPVLGAERLLAKGAGSVVVTLGSRGALMLDGALRLGAAAPRTEVRDTSGAGDVFCGVLVALLSRGERSETALARATAAASLSVTREGALASCPTADELAALPLRDVFRCAS